MDLAKAKLQKIDKFDQNKCIVEFKKPIEVIRKKKPKILTENQYVEEISKIIQRDFFPDLEKLRAQNNYLDALERKDYSAMRAIHLKYSGQGSSQPNDLTPATFETPSLYNTPLNAADRINYDATSHNLCNEETSLGMGIHKSVSDAYSLDSFLHNYTSEDNYSFKEMIETADKKLRQKFEVLYNEEKVSAEILKQALVLPSIEKQFNEKNELKPIGTWTYKNKNSIMYIPEGVQLTEQEQANMVCYKQMIKHDATRLTISPFQNFERQNTVFKSNDVTEKAKMNFYDNDKNVLAKAIPEVHGFQLMKTPSPHPGEEFSPFITWGEIEGTPFRLDGSDTPICSNAGPSFKIAENSRREMIALELAEKVGQKMRAQKQRVKDASNRNNSSPFKRSNIDRLTSMSPAARRLATTKLGLLSPIISPSTSHTYTPKEPVHTLDKTPINRTKSNSTSKNMTPAKPKLNHEISSLTDDLLKIPTKRLKASDFF